MYFLSRSYQTSSRRPKTVGHCTTPCGAVCAAWNDNSRNTCRQSRPSSASSWNGDTAVSSEWNQGTSSAEWNAAPYSPVGFPAIHTASTWNGNASAAWNGTSTAAWNEDTACTGHRNGGSTDWNHNSSSEWNRDTASVYSLFI